ncbi:MAG: DNA-protecting protein DprA [Thermoleophilia bacterium]|nr:DNA-protecting protein DprA [Thermoleophilia bacterium]
MNLPLDTIRLDELAALVALERARPKGMAAYRVAQYAQELTSAVAVIDEGLITVAPDDIKLARHDVERWLTEGNDMRSVLDPSYPANLRGAFDAPPYVFVKGEYDETWARDAVAVVGTRGASEDGIKRARKVARTLVEAGYAVLSGLARGIDRAAHEATLDAGGRTVAVMGTGIDRMYPAEHKQLAERIVASGGALISQFEPDATGARHTFPIRNATMSGLALATVVVEAGETSGAKVQALAGLKHGSGVFLLRSLYETQEWARELVDVGKYGMRAHLIDDDQQLMAALRSPHVEQEQLAFS